VELLGSTFQTGIVQAGNQVRFEVFGHMSDTVGANQLVVRINVTQQATQIPVVLTANTQALDVAFRIQGAVSFSQPGAAGRGVVSPQGATSKNEASYFGGASDSLIVGAFIRFEQTDAFASTTLRIGGNVLADNAASPSTGLSQLVTNKDQNTTLLLGGQPVGISLATVVPANTTLTVQGGWMDCL
jgi:hypothetical protein